MRTPEEWANEFAIDPVWTSLEERIRRVQQEAFLEGQLKGLEDGKQATMKVIDEVFSGKAK